MSREKTELTGTIPLLQRPSVRPEDSGTVSVEEDRRRQIRHDLRSPINQIIGFSEMLREDAEAQGLSNFVEDLSKIETAARRMVELVDAFADASVRDTVTSPPGVAPRRSLGGSGSIPLPRPEPTGGRVLAVDDDPLNREMVARRLRALGYDVETASDGPTALRCLETAAFDLVLLDVVMPGVSGLEVLERVRCQYDRGDLPVIMTTALDASTDVVEALRLGANDYVTKPLDMAVVIARIDTQLGLKQARDKVRELNLRLAAAQERVSSLADGTDPLSSAELSRSIAGEISEALGRIDVAVWVFEDKRVDAQAPSTIPMPDARELDLLRSSGRAHREEAALLAIAGPSGRLLGAIGVGIGREAFGEAEEHLVKNFARHLGSTLELGEMRKELARTAEQRRASREQLISNGVDIVHVCSTCQRCFPHTVERCEVDRNKVYPMSRPLPFRVRQRYRLQRLVGEGGMGTVFRALDERLGRDVAVKLIKADLFHNDTVRIRFEQEARTVAKIGHPSVISIFDSGEAEEGSLFMVMEWLSGQDLGQVIDQQGPGSPRQVVGLLRQVSGALDAAHRARLVHRDIKPENIFVLRDGDTLSAKVLDFGVAKEMSANSRLTQTGSLVGTPLYMSPEQVMNRPVDARSDIYSLASVAFEALTGERTVNEEHFAQVVLCVANQPAPRLSSKLPGISQELDDAFGRGLAKDPAERPKSVAEWVDGFAAMLEVVPSLNHWQF